MKSIYVCPKTKEPLIENDKGLSRNDGVFYPFIQGNNNISIPNFLTAYEHGEAAKQSLAMYDQKASVDIYRNFLDWLFQTFNEDERSFRANLIGKLKLRRGSRVLITGCGLGDDILPIINAIGYDGEVYANDLAAEMVIAASNYTISEQINSKNIYFSVCDAKLLPFPDNFFDGAFHFGGINLFDDIKLSIGEMERVVKPGSRVVFGDEGVGPWLKGVEYGCIAINNNSLWASNAPIELLPRNSMDVHLSWVLGNCFYVIDFEVSDVGPYMNIDILNKGRRGGSMRTRYFGQLEGVTEETKKFVVEDATRKGISVHDWLEQMIKEKQKQNG
jgi:ubiquinone/menaquinone biosynthesis C-methylase UbiE